MLRKNMKALSPVIASIILIAITVAVSVVVASWMGGISVGIMGNVEQATITNTEFVTSPGNSVNITIVNSGTSRQFMRCNIFFFFWLRLSVLGKCEADWRRNQPQHPAVCLG